jgi:hypothetical protein
VETLESLGQPFEMLDDILEPTGAGLQQIFDRPADDGGHYKHESRYADQFRSTQELIQAVTHGAPLEATCPAKLAIIEVRKTKYLLIALIVNLCLGVMLTLAGTDSKVFEHLDKIPKAIAVVIAVYLWILNFRRRPSLVLITRNQVFLVDGVMHNARHGLYVYRRYYRLPREAIRRSLLWGYSFTGREFKFNIKNVVSVYVTPPPHSSDPAPAGVIETRRCRELLIGRKGYGFAHDWRYWAILLLIPLFMLFMPAGIVDRRDARPPEDALYSEYITRIKPLVERQDGLINALNQIAPEWSEEKAFDHLDRLILQMQDHQKVFAAAAPTDPELAVLHGHLDARWDKLISSSLHLRKGVATRSENLVAAAAAEREAAEECLRRFIAARDSYFRKHGLVLNAQ